MEGIIFLLFMLFILGPVLAIWGARIAIGRNRSSMLWFFICYFVPFIGIGIIYFMPNLRVRDIVIPKPEKPQSMEWKCVCRYNNRKFLYYCEECGKERVD